MQVAVKERGAASIIVELSEGIITVKHSDDNSILLQWEAEEGDWAKIWDTLRFLGDKL